MNKIFLIIQREFLTRFKKKSFIIISILAPIAFALLLISPVLIDKLTKEELKTIMVIDEANIFQEALVNTQYINFDFVTNKYFDNNTKKCNLEEAKMDLKKSNYFGILYIKANTISTAIANKGEIVLYSFQQPNLGLEMHINNCIEKKIEDIKLSIKAQEFGITGNDVEEILKSINTQVKLSAVVIDQKTGNEKEISTTLSIIFGYCCGILIYFFIFMYGSMVMRGVIEEKTSRIIEIIISSVKPFQLMFGKIIGVALVGIAQFILWTTLTIIFVFIGQLILNYNIEPEVFLNSNPAIGQISTLNEIGADGNLFNLINSALNIKFGLMLIMFAVYFTGGYLLYASLFAAVGALVDNETDTQQFVFPISTFLIIGIITMFPAINNPESFMTFFASIFPFTSPIIMLARLPMGVPWSDIIISITLLFATATLCTFLSGKIYRKGILMYGKKNTWKDIFKWLKRNK